MPRIPCGAAAPIVAAATLILATSVASADVTVENRVAVTGVGIMSAGNMSGTTKTTISGERSRTDSDIQLQSRIVRMLAHGAVGPTAEIVRLDADKIDRLDLNKKQYTEQTFEELRGRIAKCLAYLDTFTAQDFARTNPRVIAHYNRGRARAGYLIVGGGDGSKVIRYYNFVSDEHVATDLHHAIRINDWPDQGGEIANFHSSVRTDLKHPADVYATIVTNAQSDPLTAAKMQKSITTVNPATLAELNVVRYRRREPIVWQMVILHAS